MGFGPHYREMYKQIGRIHTLIFNKTTKICIIQDDDDPFNIPSELLKTRTILSADNHSDPIKSAFQDFEVGYDFQTAVLFCFLHK